jgi:hypothetical protein
MDMNSPVIADAVGLVHYNLLEHLDEAEFLASKYLPWSEQDTESARVLIGDLVTVVRSLIAVHGEPDDPAAPRCALCGTEWPCPALTTIHRFLKDPDGEFVKLLRARLP